MARRWYYLFEGKFWYAAVDAAEASAAKDDLIPVDGPVECHKPVLPQPAVARYRQIAGSTNFRRLHNPMLPDPDEKESGLTIWLVGPPESLSEELSGPEVNEIAGAVLVPEPERVCAAWVHVNEMWERRSGVLALTSVNLRNLRLFLRQGDGVREVQPDSKDILSGARAIIERRVIGETEMRRLVADRAISVGR